MKYVVYTLHNMPKPSLNVTTLTETFRCIFKPCPSILFRPCGLTKTHQNQRGRILASLRDGSQAQTERCLVRHMGCWVL